MQSLLAVIDRSVLRKNAECVCRFSQRPLIAVVKDDGYGHGAVEVCHALHGLAASFAVATVQEGIALRIGGVTEPVLVLTPPLSREEAEEISAYRLTASLASLGTLALFGGTFEAHICVNTGMNRYGARPDRLRALLRAAKEKDVRVSGVYSHLYAPESARAVAEQTALFEDACRTVRGFYPGCVRHLAATGGMLAGVGYDAVRVGIALYGYLPEPFEGRLPVRPAMKLYATVADARMRLGGGVGYGFAAGESALHTLRFGYGDGFPRSGGGGVGNLCMDACVAEGKARVGARRCVLADAAAYAKAHGTIVYEVLVNVARKAERVYR